MSAFKVLLNIFPRHIFAVLSVVPYVRKVNFLSGLSRHVLGDPTMAPLRVFYGPIVQSSYP